jgi:TonB family protein
MKQIVVIIGLLFTLSCYGQSKLTQKQIEKRSYQEVVPDYSNTKDTIRPDIYPMYPFGMPGIWNDIVGKLKYPQDAYISRIQGKVILKFVVEKNGHIRNIEVVQSAQPDLDAAAIEVIGRLDTWVPGYKDGKPVRVPYLIPINFKLRNPSGNSEPDFKSDPE